MSGLEVSEHELADLGRIDPFEAWLRLRGGRPSVLLDGAGDPSEALRDVARRAYVLFDPVEIVTVPAGSAGERAPSVGVDDPLRRLFTRLATYGSTYPGDSLRFRGGAAGFVAYDVGRWFERLPDTAVARSRAPDLWFGIFDRGLEIDLATGRATMFVVAGARPGTDPAAVLREVRARLAGGVAPLGRFVASELISNFDRPRYEATVETVREYIRAGDVYQLNLSQRFEAEFDGAFESVYAALRRGNPAPFSALIDTGDLRVLSSSPESFLAVHRDRIETRPIKGTRRRTGDPEQDAILERELAASPKEVAELSMVVDLERNDLGRVAAVGSVVVEEGGRIERFATVLHRTAIVTARLDPSLGVEDLLRAAFPGGSVTGVPKIRAMELIEELERVRRGVFTGSIGFIGFDRSLELSIAIRTLVVEDGRVHFHVGGGIVLDSDPAAEYEETLLKGAALARALDRSISRL